jgi:PmbA protein
MREQQLLDLAAFVVREAKRLGATDCDVRIVSGRSVETSVRMQKVEKLQGASERSLVFRAFVGNKVASTDSSEFRRKELTQIVKRTIDTAKATEDDPFAMLPDREHLATAIPDLALFDPGLASIDADEKLRLAMETERIALSLDQRLVNSEGATFEDGSYTTTYANSRGFIGSYSTTICVLSTKVVAKEGEQMENGSWYSQKRRFGELLSPEVIGHKAAQRALSQLGSRKVPSQKAPVVYDQRMASQLLGQFAAAAYGSSIYRGKSFLIGKLGEQIARPGLQIVDEAHLRGGLGSRPFGGEGVAIGTRIIVEDGRLQNYFLDGYSARKLSMKPNGGQSSNLYVKAGTVQPEEIIKSVKSGLYLTAISGHGFNPVTGDYSVGAEGQWIENGELAYPVSGVTIASNVVDMFLQHLEAIASDLEFTSSVNSPTLKFSEMSIAGS